MMDTNRRSHPGIPLAGVAILLIAALSTLASAANVGGLRLGSRGDGVRVVLDLDARIAGVGSGSAAIASVDPSVELSAPASSQALCSSMGRLVCASAEAWVSMSSPVSAVARVC